MGEREWDTCPNATMPLTTLKNSLQMVLPVSLTPYTRFVTRVICNAIFDLLLLLPYCASFIQLVACKSSQLMSVMPRIGKFVVSSPVQLSNYPVPIICVIAAAVTTCSVAYSDHTHPHSHPQLPVSAFARSLSCLCDSAKSGTRELQGVPR